MSALLLAALALGLAGIDPAGLLIALGALAAGTRERVVVAFAGVSILGTAVLGTVLSLTAGHELQQLDWSVLAPPDWLAALVETAIAAALLVWSAARLRRPGARPPRPEGRARSDRLLVWLGVLFAGSAVLDPTFLGLVVVAGRDDSVLTISLAHLVWVLVSQVPLVVLVVAVLLGRHERFVAWTQRQLPRVRPVLAGAGTALLVVVGALLALDAGWWWVTDRFLVADPG